MKTLKDTILEAKSNCPLLNIADAKSQEDYKSASEELISFLKDNGKEVYIGDKRIQGKNIIMITNIYDKNTNEYLYSNFTLTLNYDFNKKGILKIFTVKSGKVYCEFDSYFTLWNQYTEYSAWGTKKLTSTYIIPRKLLTSANILFNKYSN